MTRIESIAIIGVGLIGGSFALAIKEAGFQGTVVGCDRAERLQAAGYRGAIDASEEDPAKAVRNAQLIVMAAPVRANTILLRNISAHVPSGALITDVGSTKREIASVASEIFGAESHRKFLPGHPIAGRELSGVEHSDASLFRGAPWVLTPVGGRRALINPEFSRGPHRDFIELLEGIGARVIVTTPEKHDRVLAFTSHLPQLISTALATTVQKKLGGTPELRDLSGRALREMVRLAKSDPQLWSEIAASNADYVRAALEEVEESLAELRKAIGNPEFTKMFAQGRELDPDAEPKQADDTDPPHFG